MADLILEGAGLALASMSSSLTATRPLPGAASAPAPAAAAAPAAPPGGLPGLALPAEAGLLLLLGAAAPAAGLPSAEVRGRAASGLRGEGRGQAGASTACGRSRQRAQRRACPDAAGVPSWRRSTAQELGRCSDAGPRGRRAAVQQDHRAPPGSARARALSLSLSHAHLSPSTASFHLAISCPAAVGTRVSSLQLFLISVSARPICERWSASRSTGMHSSAWMMATMRSNLPFCCAATSQPLSVPSASLCARLRSTSVEEPVMMAR
jgi:hypothetical protein